MRKELRAKSAHKASSYRKRATMKGRCEVDCFSTQPEVYEAILDVWRGMSQDFLRGYVESFPQRCEDVLAVNGDDAKLAPKIRNR
jgi:hypothetical protein